MGFSSIYSNPQHCVDQDQWLILQACVNKASLGAFQCAFVFFNAELKLLYLHQSNRVQPGFDQLPFISIGKLMATDRMIQYIIYRSCKTFCKLLIFFFFYFKGFTTTTKTCPSNCTIYKVSYKSFLTQVNSALLTCSLGVFDIQKQRFIFGVWGQLVRSAKAQHSNIVNSGGDRIMWRHEQNQSASDLFNQSSTQCNSMTLDGFFMSQS